MRPYSHIYLSGAFLRWRVGGWQGLYALSFPSRCWTGLEKGCILGVHLCLQWTRLSLYTRTNYWIPVMSNVNHYKFLRYRVQTFTEITLYFIQKGTRILGYNGLDSKTDRLNCNTINNWQTHVAKRRLHKASRTLMKLKLQPLRVYNTNTNLWKTRSRCCLNRAYLN